MYIIFCKCIRNTRAFSLSLSLSSSILLDIFQAHLCWTLINSIFIVPLGVIVRHFTNFENCAYFHQGGLPYYPTTLLPCSLPYPCPLCLPGKGTHLKRVNLVRLYFFINLSGAVDAGSDASSEASSAKKRTLQRPDLQSQIILLLIPFRSKVLSWTWGSCSELLYILLLLELC